MPIFVQKREEIHVSQRQKYRSFPKRYSKYPWKTTSLFLNYQGCRNQRAQVKQKSFKISFAQLQLSRAFCPHIRLKDAHPSRLILGGRVKPESEPRKWHFQTRSLFCSKIFPL